LVNGQTNRKELVKVGLTYMVAAATL